MDSLTKRDLIFFISGIIFYLFIIWILEFIHIEYATNPKDKDLINKKIKSYKDNYKSIKIKDLDSAKNALVYDILSNVTYNSKENISSLKFSSISSLNTFEANTIANKDNIYNNALNSFTNLVKNFNKYLEPGTKESIGLNQNQRFTVAATKTSKSISNIDKIIFKYLNTSNTLKTVLDLHLSPAAKLTLAAGGANAIKNLFKFLF